MFSVDGKNFQIHREMNSETINAIFFKKIENMSNPLYNKVDKNNSKGDSTCFQVIVYQIF